MDGIYLFGIREGCHPSLIASARDTADGRRFLKAKHEFWKSQRQGWDILFLLRITAQGRVLPVAESDTETWR